jgi:hypothetical protein
MAARRGTKSSSRGKRRTLLSRIKSLIKRHPGLNQGELEEALEVTTWEEHEKVSEALALMMSVGVVKRTGSEWGRM